MIRAIRRLARMRRAELRARLVEGARTAGEAIAYAAERSRWRPERLASRLNQHGPTLREAAAAIRAGDRRRAHNELRRHFSTRARRFPIHPPGRRDLAAAIIESCNGAQQDARRRANRIREGSYDLLGYSGLSFRTGVEIDWHFDPVHRRRAATGFWRGIDFLDPRHGDHKIIWELNRHQHWLALGRAAWLTGDATYARVFAGELRSWMRANPPLTGMNWASMLELALRSISWLWALHFFVDLDDDPDAEWLVDLLTGVDRQLEHVAGHLSTYFSPNTHLLGEALALYVAGRALPELTASARWETLGRRVLLEEAARQVLADGGHAERSAHYHRYTLDFYLLALSIARLTGDDAAGPFEKTVSRLAWYCRSIADDRGHLPLIGDDDGGALFPICGREAADASDSLSLAAALLVRPELAVADPAEEVLWMLGGDWSVLAQPPHGAAIPSQLFPETGYAALRSSDAVAIVDVGRHGYLNGGHAHADALSIVLTVRGVPLLIDPGTGTYTMNPPARDRFRSSAMHNTVVVDGRSQSEPAGPFHWRTQAHAQVDRWRPSAAFDYLEAGHEGYSPLIHRRAILATRNRLWVVADHLLGTGAHRAEVFWHLAPIRQHGPHVAVAATAGEAEHLFGDPDGLGWWAPVFGRVEAAPTLRFSSDLTVPATIVTAIAASEAPLSLSVAAAPVAAQADGWHRAGAAIHIADERLIAAFATVVSPAATSRVYRVEAERGTLVTDARAVLLRLSSHDEPLSVSLVDATCVRWTGALPFSIELPEAAADLHLDLAAERRLSRVHASPAAG